MDMVDTPKLETKDTDFTERINEITKILTRNNTKLEAAEEAQKNKELEGSKMMREWATDIWRINREHPHMPLDGCLRMIRVTRSLKDSCSHQDAADNYRVALRVTEMLMERVLLVGDDELLKSDRKNCKNNPT